MPLLILLFFVSYSITEGKQTFQLDSTTADLQTAQYESPSETQATPYVTVSGEAGAYGELYTISGRDRRRPPASGRLYFRPTLTFFDNFSISFDFLISSEGSSARQQINQFALHPTWSWGRAHIGDFSHDFSRYTLNGLTIRGAGLELYPSIIRLQVIGGQTQRAIAADPYSSVYSRYIAGAKLGVGKEESMYFDLIAVKVKDDPSSLSRNIFRQITPNETDTTRIDTTFIGNTPQENIVLGAVTSLRLFENKFRIKGEIAGSVFTRDLYSSEITSGSIPSSLTSVFKPRISTNADIAYTIETGATYQFADVQVGYTAIGPGYTSLGIPSLSNDKKILDTKVGLRFFENRLMIQGLYQGQHDNLLSQKQFTTSYTTYGLMTNIRPISEVAIMLNAMHNTITNDSNNDTTKINNVSSNYGITVSYLFSVLHLTNTLTTGYSTQLSKDLNVFRSGNEVRSQNINITLNTILTPQYSLAPSFSYSSVAPQGRNKIATTNFNFRVINRMLAGKLSNSGGIGFMNSTTSRSTTITFQSNYALSQAHSLTASLRSSYYRYKSVRLSPFNEHTASIGYVYRF